MNEQRHRSRSPHLASLDIARTAQPNALGRRRGRIRRFANRIARHLGWRRGVESKPDGGGREFPATMGPKKRLLREREGRDSFRRGLGYLAGFLILGFSIWQASRVLTEHGSEGGMVNVLLGIFSGIVVLFLLSHDTAVDRRQRAKEHDGA